MGLFDYEKLTFPFSVPRSIGNDGTVFYLVTNKDAPLEKIITVDIADSTFTPKDLVPEQSDSKLVMGTLIKDHLVTVYKKNVRGFFSRMKSSGQVSIIRSVGQRRDLHP